MTPETAVNLARAWNGAIKARLLSSLKYSNLFNSPVLLKLLESTRPLLNLLSRFNIFFVIFRGILPVYHTFPKFHYSIITKVAKFSAVK